MFLSEVFFFEKSVKSRCRKKNLIYLGENPTFQNICEICTVHKKKGLVFGKIKAFKKICEITK